MEKGFSLVETLVVVAVIAILGLIMVELLFRTIKGGTKTQLIGIIKQNGQTTLSTLDYAIRQADAVVCPSTSDVDKPVLVVVKNGVFSRYFFYTPSSGNGYIASDSPAPADPRCYNDLTLTSCDLSLSIDLCANTNGWPSYCTNPTGAKIACPTPPASNASILTDKLNTSLITGTFKRNRLPGTKDVVFIDFDLAPPPNSGGGPENQIGTNNKVHFSTTSELR